MFLKLDEHRKKYFQYIINDLTQLNSDVIRTFKQVFYNDSHPDLLEVVKTEVEFYAHCVTIVGVKLGYWEKIGNIIDVGNTNHILFRSSGDAGNRKITVSKDWWVWKINEPQKRVGKLVGENQKAEMGMVFDPISIINRIRTGEYGGRYPGF